MNKENLSNQQPKEYIGRYFSVQKLDENTYRYCVITESGNFCLLYALLQASAIIPADQEMNDERRESYECNIISKLSAIGYLLSPPKEGEEQPVILGVPHPSNKEQGAIGLSMFGYAVKQMKGEKSTWAWGQRDWLKFCRKQAIGYNHLFFIDDIVHNLRKKTFTDFIYSESIVKYAPKIYACTTSPKFIEKAQTDNHFHLLYFGESWRTSLYRGGEDIERVPFLPMIAEDCIGIYNTFGLIKEELPTN